MSASQLTHHDGIEVVYSVAKTILALDDTARTGEKIVRASAVNQGPSMLILEHWPNNVPE